MLVAMNDSRKRQRNRLPLVFTWTCIFLMLFLAALISSPQRKPNTQYDYASEEQANQRRSSEQPNSKSFWVRITNIPVTIHNGLTLLFTAVLAISTIALAVSTVLLWRETKRTVTDAGEEFIATHRPRVVVRYVRGPIPSENDVQSIEVGIVNIGETPAMIEQFGGDLARREIGGTWNPPGLFAHAKDIPPFEMKSGDRKTFTVKAKHPYGVLNILAEVQGKEELCAVGEIRYRDAIGRLRETGFCRIYDQASGKFIPSDFAEDEHQD